MVSSSRFDLNFCAPHSTIHWSLFYVSIGISPPNAPPHNDRCLALHLNFASLPHNGVHYVLQIQWSRLFFNGTSLLEKILRFSAFLLVVGKKSTVIHVNSIAGQSIVIQRHSPLSAVLEEKSSVIYRLLTFGKKSLLELSTVFQRYWQYWKKSHRCSRFITNAGRKSKILHRYYHC